MICDIILYYSPINKNYFSNENLICQDCKKSFNTLLIINYWKKKAFSNKIICTRCIKTKNNDFGIVKEKKLVICCRVLPEDCIPIYIRPPEITESNRNITNFELADKQIENEKVKDNTKHCHNPDFMKDKNYVEFDIKSLEHKDKEIKTYQAFDLLDNLQSANKKAIIQSKETKKLEDKSATKNS